MNFAITSLCYIMMSLHYVNIMMLCYNVMSYVIISLCYIMMSLHYANIITLH